MTGWVRLWHEMPTDPKWRAIARRSGRSISEVIAVFNFVMVNASSNSIERGRIHNLSPDDIGAALDLEDLEVQSILDAMQGKVLDGDRLSGWTARQPKREDGSAERAKQWREEQKIERKRTHPNASKRPDTETDTDTDADADRLKLEINVRKKSQGIATLIDPDFQPSMSPRAARLVAGWPTGMLEDELFAFIAHAQANGRMQIDWQAAFCMWIKRTNDKMRQNHGTTFSEVGQRRTAQSFDNGKSGFARALQEDLLKNQSSGLECYGTSQTAKRLPALD